MVIAIGTLGGVLIALFFLWLGHKLFGKTVTDNTPDNTNQYAFPEPIEEMPLQADRSDKPAAEQSS